MTGEHTSSQSGRIIRPSDLFRLIWPTEGWKCIALKSPDGPGMRHEFVETIEEAENVCLHWDALLWGVFHAMAGFNDFGKRTQANVRSLRSFWLDLDVGPGKGYADLQSAWRALNGFVKHHGLPDPIIVGSGSGMHLYWPLDASVDHDRWLAVANRLKHACEQFGFHADPARTCDSASILRPPGTRNWKYAHGPVVTAGAAVQAVSLEKFASGFAGSVPENSVAAVARDGGGPRAPGAKDQLTVDATTIYATVPTSGEKIANECAQVREMRDSHGCIPEPRWHGCLEVLVHCDDGRRVAHAWSVGHPNYTREETDRYLDRVSKFGPTTCSRLHGLNPDPCSKCPHWGKIRSPIKLGRETEMVMAPKEMVDVTDGLPPPPSPFHWNQRSLGWWAKDEDADADPTAPAVWITLYRHPILVTGFRRGESAGGRSLAIKHYNPHEGWSEETIEIATVDAKTIMGKLMHVGINIHGKVSKQLMDWLHKSIDRVADARKADVDYDQFGWKEDGSFLIGDDLCTAPDGVMVKVGLSSEAARRADMMRPRGYLENWAVAANQLFQTGFEGQAFALLCGFAAPLMRFLRDKGGCIVHQVGATGQGKSMGLRGAWTIWGEENAVNVNSIDTMRSRYRQLGVLSNLPVIFDELIERDHEKTKDFILAFTDGRDANRLDRDGHLKALRYGWSTLIISAANRSLVQAAMSENEHAQAARVLEYPVSMPDHYDQSAGTRLEKMFEANRGHAGRVFMQGIVQKQVFEAIPAQIVHFQTKYAAAIGRGPEHRFYSALLAAVKVAGDLLTHWEMLELSIERYIDFGLNAAAVNRAGIIDQMPNYPRTLQRFINSHWRNTLGVPRMCLPEQVVEPYIRPTDTVLAVRIERHEKMMYIDRQVIRDWATENHVLFNEMEAVLRNSGLVVDAAFRKNLGTGTAWAAGGFVPCWRINLAHQHMQGLSLVTENGEAFNNMDLGELDRDAREGA